jgi:hypothetical protein
MMDKYYLKALEYLEAHDVERALTAFIGGVDRGFAKCGFGILKIAVEIGTNTLTEDEALSIFLSCYDEIRLMADGGDDEAMVMVAEAIRYGVADDDDPYFLWLWRAFELGNIAAADILAELDREMIAEELTLAAGTALVALSDGATDPEAAYTQNINYERKEEHTLISDADPFLIEDCGIADVMYNTDH